MIAFVGRFIFAIPLFLTGLIAKGGAKLFSMGTTFLAEIIGILLFKSRWWIASICWTAVLWVLVKIQPFVKQYLPHPIWAVYIRFIILIMFLMLLAYVTRNIRRAFRRARLEVKVLNVMREGGKHIEPQVQKTTGVLKGIIEKFISSARNASRAEEPVVVTVPTSSTSGYDSSSYEATMAAMAAEAEAHVRAATTEGEFKEEERPDWMKSKPNNKTTDPLLRAQELEEEAQRLRKSAKRKSDSEEQN